MPYPPRPERRVLPEFVGTAKSRPDPAVQARVEQFIEDGHAAGKSLRELAEMTGRSFSAVRNALDKRGVRRRPTGAARLAEELMRGAGSPVGETPRRVMADQPRTAEDPLI